MSDPLYAFPTVCGQTLRALARYPSRVAFSWPGGSITYAGATELIGRIQKVFMQLGLEPGTRVAFLTANRADSWCAGIAAQLSRLAITWLHPLGSLDDQLFQIEDSEAQDAGGRRRYVQGSRRRPRHPGIRPGQPSSRSAPPITASICWPRSRHAGTASASLFCRPRRCRDAELHRRHHREIQRRAAHPPRVWRLRQRDSVRLRNSRYAALSHGGADQPCRRHQGAADADARRHRAHAQGFRSGRGVQDHRARAHQLHAVRADHDLCAAGPSGARQHRPVLARTLAVRRLGDVAEPAGRGHRADRPGVLAAVRPDRVLSGLGAAQGGSRSENAGIIPVLRLPDRRLRGQDSRR